MATGPMGVSQRPKPKVPIPQKPTTGAPTPPAGGAGGAGDGILTGRGGRKFKVPGAVWSAVPEVERAGLMDAFRRQGMGGLKNASTGKPWANDLAQAIAGARGAVQNKPGARPAATPAPDQFGQDLFGQTAISNDAKIALSDLANKAKSGNPDDVRAFHEALYSPSGIGANIPHELKVKLSEARTYQPQATGRPTQNKPGARPGTGAPAGGPTPGPIPGGGGSSGNEITEPLTGLPQRPGEPIDEWGMNEPATRPPGVPPDAKWVPGSYGRPGHYVGADGQPIKFDKSLKGGAPDTNPRGVPGQGGFSPGGVWNGPAPGGVPGQPQPFPGPGGSADGGPEASGGAAGGAQSPYLTMQGGKGGYSVDEWNGLKAFIATQPAAIQQQIMAGIDAVPGERGQKFDYLLGQIKKFAGGAGGVASGGDGGGVPGMPPGPSPRPDAHVPAGGIVNNWKPSDPAWVASIEQKFGPGTVQKVQQEMSAAVANLPEGTGARRAAIYGILQKYGLAAGGGAADTNPRLPHSQGGGLPVTPGSPDGAPIPTPGGGGMNQGVVPTYTPPPLTQAPPPVQAQPPAQTLPDIFIPF